MRRDTASVSFKSSLSTLQRVTIKLSDSPVQALVVRLCRRVVVGVGCGVEVCVTGAGLLSHATLAKLQEQGRGAKAASVD